VPHRGKMNEPGFVRHVGEFIGTLKGLPQDQVGHQTTENFFNLFNILR
jgi:TatD DNase family protein